MWRGRPPTGAVATPAFLNTTFLRRPIIPAFGTASSRVGPRTVISSPVKHRAPTMMGSICPGPLFDGPLGAVRIFFRTCPRTHLFRSVSGPPTCSDGKRPYFTCFYLPASPSRLRATLSARTALEILPALDNADIQRPKGGWSVHCHRGDASERPLGDPQASPGTSTASTSSEATSCRFPNVSEIHRTAHSDGMAWASAYSGARAAVPTPTSCPAFVPLRPATRRSVQKTPVRPWTHAGPRQVDVPFFWVSRQLVPALPFGLWSPTSLL